MSVQQLQAVTGNNTAPAAPARNNTIAGLLVDPKIKQQIALALPKHMTADRLARIALTEVRRNPELGKCDQASFLGAVMQCAALGLEPGGALGHCYLIPFKNNRKNIIEVQFLVGYRGMIDLARRSGQILSIEARSVYSKDKFKVRLGLDSTIEHEPAWEEADRGEITFVYAVAKLKDGGTQFDVMSRAELTTIRNSSQGYKTAERYGKSSPWHDHFEEMAKKTVIRRLFKYLPVSIEMQRAVGLDEQASADISQDNALMLGYDASPALEHDVAAAEGSTTVAQNAPLGISFGEVEKNLRAATTREALDDAADLIRDVDSPEDRQKLNAIFDERLQAFGEG
jgi:recombination protein RecT